MSESPEHGNAGEDTLHVQLFFLVTLAVLSVGVILKLTAIGTPLAGPHAPDGIISFEVAAFPEKAKLILDQWKDTELLPGEARRLGRESADGLTALDSALSSLKWDFVFIPLYATTIALACWLLASSFRRQIASMRDRPDALLSERVCRIGHRFGKWLAVALAGAAVLDCIEDVALLRLLTQYDPSHAPGRPWTLLAAGSAWLKFGILAVAFLYLAAASILLGWEKGRWVIRRMVLVRVPILITLVVWLLAFLGMFGPSTFRNVMVTRSFIGPVIIAFQVILTLKLCEFIGRFVWEVSQRRFGVPENPGVPAILDPDSSEASAGGCAIIIRFYLFLMPLLAVVMWRHEWGDHSKWLSLPRACAAVFTGAVLAQLFLMFVEGSTSRILQNVRARQGTALGNQSTDEATVPKLTQQVSESNWSIRIGRFLDRWFGPGFIWEEGDDATDPSRKPGQLRIEHIQLALNFAALFAIYVVAGVFLWPEWRFVDWPPPLAYVLGLLMLLLSILSALAFLLDRYRIPLLAGIFLWIGLMHGLHRVDHIFELSRGGVAAADPVASLENRLKVGRGDADMHTGEGVVTVVCAAGGGIQAAAWTARVLEELCADEELGRSFGRSIALISSTSGGSTGAYHFLETFSEEGVPGADVPNGGVFDAAFSSSLEEALWGLLYPDAARALFPIHFPRRHDRGWAIERAWLRHTNAMLGKPGRAPTRWSDWTRRTESGALPAVIFNSTIVESGQQLLLSTVDLGDADDASPQRGTTTLQSVYGQQEPVDLDAVTAARLSATFPLISPASRARFDLESRKLGHAPAWHVVDGGFYDNPAIVPALTWMRQVLVDDAPKAHIRKVLVIHIDGFPAGVRRDRFDSLEAPGGRGQSVAAAALWPVQTLASVRGSSQTSRGMFELELLADRFPQIVQVSFRPGAYPSGEAPPLSWQLSATDRTHLDESWKLQKEGPACAAIRELFEPAAP